MYNNAEPDVTLDEFLIFEGDFKLVCFKDKVELL